MPTSPWPTIDTRTTDVGNDAATWAVNTSYYHPGELRARPGMAATKVPRLLGAVKALLAWIPGVRRPLATPTYTVPDGAGREGEDAIEWWEWPPKLGGELQFPPFPPPRQVDWPRLIDPERRQPFEDPFEDPVERPGDPRRLFVGIPVPATAPYSEAAIAISLSWSQVALDGRMFAYEVYGVPTGGGESVLLIRGGHLIPTTPTGVFSSNVFVPTADYESLTLRGWADGILVTGSMSVAAPPASSYVAILGTEQSGTLGDLLSSARMEMIDSAEARAPFPVDGTKRLARSTGRGFRLVVAREQTAYLDVLADITASDPSFAAAAIWWMSVDAGMMIGGDLYPTWANSIVNYVDAEIDTGPQYFTPDPLYNDMGTFFDGTTSGELIVQGSEGEDLGTSEDAYGAAWMLACTVRVDLVLHEDSDGGFRVEEMTEYDPVNAPGDYAWVETGERISIEEALSRGYILLEDTAGPILDLTGRVEDLT